MEELFKKYEQKFTDLFLEMYEECGREVNGISCERKGPNIATPKGGVVFVQFNVW